MFDYNKMPREAVATPICDFCNDKNVTWRYPANSFVVDEVKYVSQNDWAACAQCSDCIERRDFNALAKRSPGYPKLLEYVDEEIAVATIVGFHLLFVLHRTGPRIKV